MIEDITNRIGNIANKYMKIHAALSFIIFVLAVFLLMFFADRVPEIGSSVALGTLPDGQRESVDHADAGCVRR